MLLLVAVLSVAYALRDRWHKAADNKLDQAFAELAAATANNNYSPDTLLSIAEQYDGHGAVGELARLDAADAYLDALRRGIKPGAVLKTDKDHQGELEKADDVLTDADRTDFLKRAGDLYQQVFDKTSGKRGQELLTLNSLYGLAAVAEGRQEYDKAKGYYEQVAKLADANALPAHAALANERITKLPDLRNIPKLYAKAELPPPPKKEEPVPVPAPAPAPAAAPAGPTPTPSPLTSPTPPPPEPAPAPAPAEPAPASPAPGPAPSPTPDNPTTPPK
jgi:tetratricopeptide (TPR) repeat protein